MAVTAKQLRESLIQQLKNKEANVECFVSLIDDYIFYWQREKEMQKDVKKNGLRYTRKSAKGIDIEVENPSVKSAIMYNKQKLAIIKDLGLNVSTVTSSEDADDKL